MILEMIGTVVAGIAAAGLVLIARHLLGERVPKWLIPIAAGAGMLAATISSEYGWYNRTLAALPEGMEVAQTVDSRAPWRPWTYLVPYVERFVVVDTAGTRLNAAVPGQRIVDLYFFGRWAPVNKVTALLDCEGNRRAALVEGASFDDSGQVAGASWTTVTAEDPILRVGCGVS